MEDCNCNLTTKSLSDLSKECLCTHDFHHNRLLTLTKYTQGLTHGNCRLCCKGSQRSLNCDVANKSTPAPAAYYVTNTRENNVNYNQSEIYWTNNMKPSTESIHDDCCYNYENSENNYDAYRTNMGYQNYYNNEAINAFNSTSPQQCSNPQHCKCHYQNYDVQQIPTPHQCGYHSYYNQHFHQHGDDTKLLYINSINGRTDPNFDPQMHYYQQMRVISSKSEIARRSSLVLIQKSTENLNESDDHELRRINSHLHLCCPDPGYNLQSKKITYTKPNIAQCQPPAMEEKKTQTSLDELNENDDDGKDPDGQSMRTTLRKKLKKMAYSNVKGSSSAHSGKNTFIAKEACKPSALIALHVDSIKDIEKSPMINGFIQQHYNKTLQECAIADKTHNILSRKLKRDQILRQEKENLRTQIKNQMYSKWSKIENKMTDDNPLLQQLTINANSYQNENVDQQEVRTPRSARKQSAESNDETLDTAHEKVNSDLEEELQNTNLTLRDSDELNNLKISKLKGTRNISISTESYPRLNTELKIITKTNFDNCLVKNSITENDNETDIEVKKDNITNLENLENNLTEQIFSFKPQNKQIFDDEVNQTTIQFENLDTKKKLSKKIKPQDSELGKTVLVHSAPLPQNQQPTQVCIGLCHTQIPPEIESINLNKLDSIYEEQNQPSNSIDENTILKFISVLKEKNPSFTTNDINDIIQNLPNTRQQDIQNVINNLPNIIGQPSQSDSKLFDEDVISVNRYDTENPSNSLPQQQSNLFQSITACRAYFNPPSSYLIEPAAQMRPVKLNNINNDKLNEIMAPKSVKELQIDRTPVSCPITACNRLVFISEFIRHIKVDHTKTYIESIAPGQCRNLFLDPKIIQHGVNKCHNLYLVTQKIKDLGSREYKDYLPVMVMTTKISLLELVCSSYRSRDEAILDSKQFYIIIWLTGLIASDLPIYYSLIAWARGDKKVPKCHIVQSGKLYSFREEQNAKVLYKKGQAILLSNEMCDLLTDNGKNMIEIQVIIH